MITRQITVWCDICQLTWDQLSAVSPRAARRELAQSGWHYTKGKDWCPGCRSKTPAEIGALLAKTVRTAP